MTGAEARTRLKAVGWILSVNVKVSPQTTSPAKQG
jgi:hypothetical protein